jgi:hypothetical protein
MNPKALRGLLLALISSLALAAPAAAGAAIPEESDRKTLLEEIRKHRAKTWHRQAVMGKPRTPRQLSSGRQVSSLASLSSVRDFWRRRSVRTRRQLRRPPHRAEWLCIQGYEGPWNDPNEPYFGGLQMDISFQRSYGRYLLRRKGTANYWTPAEQMRTAEKALRTGGSFHPWPVAARACGLI